VKVAIVGLGLIGGSLARDLSARGHAVFGADRSKATLKKAKRAGAIAAALPASLEGIEETDLCVIALPVDATRDVLRKHRKRLRQVKAVTDVGSTKQSIMRAAADAGLAASFVGSHPMAGGETSGWGAARRGLFKDQRVYVCAARGTDVSGISLVNRLWRDVGGRIERIDAAAHDRLLAATSHLPQVVALALAMIYASARLTRGQLGRGGREMTRLAASSGEMWSAILSDHPKNVNGRIRSIRRVLSRLEAAVGRRDTETIRRWFRRSNAWSRQG
jgi:prephenate dehydrogenase